MKKRQREEDESGLGNRSDDDGTTIERRSSDIMAFI